MEVTMAQGIRPGEKQNAREVYGDIIDHPHWVSPKHPQMSLYKRAAQFAPFAALSGYEEMIDESTRVTDHRIELSESEKDLLNMKLNRLMEATDEGNRPEADITYFVPDLTKAGGRYDKITARIKRVDAVHRRIMLETRDREDLPESIAIDRVYDIHGEILDDLEDRMYGFSD